MFETTTSNITNQPIITNQTYSQGITLSNINNTHKFDGIYYPVSAEVNGVNLSFSGRKALTARKIESYRRFSRKVNELTIDKLFIKLLTL